MRRFVRHRGTRRAGGPNVVSWPGGFRLMERVRRLPPWAADTLLALALAVPTSSAAFADPGAGVPRARLASSAAARADCPSRSPPGGTRCRLRRHPRRGGSARAARGGRFRRRARSSRSTRSPRTAAGARRPGPAWRPWPGSADAAERPALGANRGRRPPRGVRGRLASFGENMRTRAATCVDLEEKQSGSNGSGSSMCGAPRPRSRRESPASSTT